jgi:hypothetical protein
MGVTEVSRKSWLCVGADWPPTPGGTEGEDSNGDNIMMGVIPMVGIVVTISPSFSL